MIEVVIPAYNAARFLRETLESVAAQTELPERVTVVDDRSTDGTRAVAEKAARELAPRIVVQVIDNAGPRGPSGARNAAIRAQGPPLVALLDADDLLRPGHHAALRRVLGAAPDLVLGFGDHTVFGPAGNVQASGLATSGVASAAAEEIAPGVLSLGGGTFPALLGSGIFGTSACMFKRNAAIGAGLFDEAMMHGEDTDLFLRMALCGPFGFVREIIADKRVHDANLTDPRNALHFRRGTVRSLLKLAARDDLATPQRDALRAALRPAVGGHLYAASRTGLRAYREAAGMARRAGEGRLALRPRTLLRLALHRVLGPATPAR